METINIFYFLQNTLQYKDLIRKSQVINSSFVKGLVSPQFIPEVFVTDIKVSDILVLYLLLNL